MGIIDDFDDDLTPRLVTELAESLAKCKFKLITASSHDITAAMKAKNLHIGVAASTGEVLDSIVEHPLVRDPFILVTPTSHAPTGADLNEVMQDLPILRYDGDQLIARQIDAHLSRLKLKFTERFEISSHLALMACVARGIGWSITTPLGFMRAVRFHDHVTAHPLPFAGFSRQISLFAGTDWDDQVPRDVAQTIRRLVEKNVISPAIRSQPFLKGELRVLSE